LSAALALLDHAPDLAGVLLAFLAQAGGLIVEP
jgi:hypothetical protein